jgi:hypothetical protein
MSKKMGHRESGDGEKRFCESNNETTGRCGGNNALFYFYYFFTETEALYSNLTPLLAARKVEGEYELPSLF